MVVTEEFVHGSWEGEGCNHSGQALEASCGLSVGAKDVISE